MGKWILPEPKRPHFSHNIYRNTGWGFTLHVRSPPRRAVTFWKQLDFNDALLIIQQLIDGIEAAHEKNIVHRDLKPANIKITPDGMVKILDFGLAKAANPQPRGSSHPGDSPTLTAVATAVGTILGTAGYMAPEQARGEQADKRSDIWSFGVILFELLTGKKLFPGKTTGRFWAQF
jgi:serine/threonine-protein kinase